jgi:N-acetylmuramoyl-L-alanine amidase
MNKKNKKNKKPLRLYKGLYKKIPARIRLLLTIAVFILLALLLKGMSGYFFHDGSDTKAHLKDNGSKNFSDGIEDNEEEQIKPEPKEVIIVIDPGHGGEDYGAIYGEICEKDINIDISKRFGKLLEEKGLKVVYTRETDVFVDLDPRVDIANSLDATLFISVHNNYMPGNSQYRGTETLYCPPVNARYSNMDGEKLALIVQEELVKTLGTIDNGIIYRPNLAVIRKTNMPAVIAEIAYMSNASDRANLMKDGFRQKSAEALLRAVMKALEKMEAVRDEDGVWKVTEE